MQTHTSTLCVQLKYHKQHYYWCLIFWIGEQLFVRFWTNHRTQFSLNLHGHCICESSVYVIREQRLWMCVPGGREAWISSSGQALGQQDRNRRGAHSNISSAWGPPPNTQTVGKASSRGSSGLGICAKRKAWVPKGTPKAEVCRVVAVASGQGCSEMLQCLQGSWAACVRNHATGWGGENWGRKKRSLGGAGNRVGIHAQLRGQSRPQCTGPQTLWGLQVPTQGTPGVPFPPLLHSPPSGHTVLPAPPQPAFN